MINKKLGYYDVDGIEFDSKIQAMYYAKSNNKTLSWHFNDLAYKSYDWTVEPTQSLDQLYDQHARLLRDKYDYLVLSYSGGADSHNILMSFIRQGLHIDEIVVNTMEKGYGKFVTNSTNNLSASNAGAEHDLQTMPRLKEVCNLIPNTKITICDLTEYLFEYLEEKGDESWVFDKRESLHPASLIRFNYLHFTDVRKQFDKDKTFGVIIGLEKPRCFIYKNKLYVNFTDRATNLTTISEHFKQYPNSTIEFFYWSPDTLDMQCKQIHTIKRWLEANPNLQHLWDAEKELSGEKAINTIKLTHERLLRPLLYSTWNNQWYQADKALGDWHSEFDQWFFDGYKDSNAFRIWQAGIDFVVDSLDNFTRKSTTGKVDGFQIFTKRYYIGDMKPTLI